MSYDTNFAGVPLPDHAKSLLANQSPDIGLLRVSLLPGSSSPITGKTSNPVGSPYPFM
jgi:hypothetical protein